MRLFYCERSRAGADLPAVRPGAAVLLGHMLLHEPLREAARGGGVLPRVVPEDLVPFLHDLESAT